MSEGARLADSQDFKGGKIMCNTIKRPPVVQGSNLVHRRAEFGHNAVCEQGYFTRYTIGKAKPEVRS